MGWEESFSSTSTVTLCFAPGCLNDGKVGDEAMANAKHGELETYGRRLQRELDDFINGDMDRRHAVAIEHDELSGMVEVNLTKDVEATRKVSVLSANRE